MDTWVSPVLLLPSLGCSAEGLSFALAWHSAWKHNRRGTVFRAASTPAFLLLAGVGHLCQGGQGAARKAVRGSSLPC